MKILSKTDDKSSKNMSGTGCNIRFGTLKPICASVELFISYQLVQETISNPKEYRFHLWAIPKNRY
jgi:hypothetical protein